MSNITALNNDRMSLVINNPHYVEVLIKTALNDELEVGLWVSDYSLNEIGQKRSHMGSV